ncbi:MAG TPA: 2,3-bisphosphoglycerate-independent phosphoglycerate mutase [Candidatus Saccharimonadia bacterium]|nr:2,3-bisphosphoglycerate-independent phosphoglycerate mutase [Candidatus Saccharimonadia bacterium]
MLSRPKPVLLLILDGWGHRDETDHNAIAQARLPNWRRLVETCPHTLVQTHGLHVGLPPEQMGNSEVGHMNIGAGRVVYQDLTRIDESVRDGSFARNPALARAIEVARGGGTLHVFGLLSPGGVHASEDHILALLDACDRGGARDVAVHAFLDGRDTPPQSAGASLERLLARCHETGARVATVTGRYYAMDRDNRWERVEPAYRAITDAHAEHHAPDPVAALAAAYARGETDEFVRPTVLAEHAPMRDGDAVVFMNFRADRARELTRAFVAPGFDGFVRPRAIALAEFVTLTEYAADLPVTAVAFAPQSTRNTLPEYLAALGLRQLRIAETEKYAHVTFFFNGGREQPFAGEDRILVPSPRVATYDLKPEMSCPEVTAKLCDAIRSRVYDVIVCNIANADMVGHTGVFAAAVKAAETIDWALGEIVAALRVAGGEMLVTADHGNLEQMRDEASDQPHTAHTLGPVPLVYFGRDATLLPGGALSDLAPSVLALMGLPQPGEMTGRSLVALR